jgi:hypothetical protein
LSRNEYFSDERVFAWAYGHGLSVVSPRSAIPYPSTPCRRATPEMALQPTGRAACDRIYRFGHPMPYAHLFVCRSSSRRRRVNAIARERKERFMQMTLITKTSSEAVLTMLHAPKLVVSEEIQLLQILIHRNPRVYWCTRCGCPFSS